MGEEPVTGEIRDLVQRTRFLEQMRGTGDHVELVLAAQLRRLRHSPCSVQVAKITIPRAAVGITRCPGRRSGPPR